ncbi:hypothetical protein CHUAL_003710 [Chamberlinius hualienensis]
MHSIYFALLLWTVIVSATNDEWEQYKSKYGKFYGDKNEDETHMGVYFNRKSAIEAHNLLFERGLTSFSMSINKWTDQLLMANHVERVVVNSASKTSLLPFKMASYVPDAIDWSKNNRVTNVKDEGSCKCSWAFGIAGSLEGLRSETSELISLSPQNLIDCSRNYGTNGCQLSRTDDAIRYAIDNNGIASEDSYPYTATDDSACKYSNDMSSVQPSGYLEIVNGDEETLKNITGLLGPVTATIIITENFYSYSEGVFVDDCTVSSGVIYHTVLIIGYGSDASIDYWILKNCYGTDWGESGFMRFRRNYNNMCGIASIAIIPIM